MKQSWELKTSMSNIALVKGENLDS